MSPIDSAIQFAECGFSVFPLYKTSKNNRQPPFGWSGGTVAPENLSKVIAASNDVDYIKIWEDEVKDKYNSVITGFAVLGKSCVILDIDVKNGKDGMSHFLQMSATHKLPQPTMFTTTKSGGLHAYFKRPDKYIDTHIKTLANVSISGVKYEGVDLRGDGGYVVGPDELVEVTSLEPGKYKTKGLRAIDELPEFPETALIDWVRNTMSDDLDRLNFGSDELSADYMTLINRGQIPDHIPLGGRNNAFYIFANASKSKGVPREACLEMMKIMGTRCESPETLADSVNFNDILDRSYVIHENNPFDVAVDLVNRGLFQLTNHKSKLHYIILEPNPYLASRTAHDEGTIRTLLTKFQKSVQQDQGKAKTVNPMDIIPKVITDSNRASSIGFKPGASQVFTMHDDENASRYLNTYKPLMVPKTPDGLDLTIWDELTFIIARIFGPQGSDSYQLGLDFIAHLIQHPEIKPSIAPFIMSHIRGVGKSLFFNTIIHILGTSKDGERQGRLTKLDELQGRFFNPSGCVLNLIDEVQFPVHRDTRKESVTFWRHLKNLITAETISVELKGGVTYQAPNAAALMLAGNTGSHFPVEEMDRRLWIIDANPPELEHGVVDRLFMIIKGQTLGPDDRRKLINTMRYQLSHHKIQHDIGGMRAPATDVKRDMFMNGLTDHEEWFLSHFTDPEALFAATPVISASAFMYVAATTDKLMNTKWREDLHGLYRDYKRRGMLRPIRVKGNGNQSRSLAHPIIGGDGQIFTSDRREVLYTTRDHGSFDLAENKEVLFAYMQNCHTIKHFKGKVKSNMKQEIYRGMEDENVEL